MSCRARGAQAAAILSAPGPAVAHSPVPGIEGFYSGLAVPVSEPAFGFAALALALLLMHDFPDRIRHAWPAIFIGTALGIAAARPIGGVAALEPALLACAAVLAGLAALSGDRGTAPALVVSPLAGLVIGAAAVPDPGPWRPVAIGAAGAVVGAALPLFLLGAGLDWLRERADGQALRIGLRVAASWIAALAFLMLALVLRPT